MSESSTSPETGQTYQVLARKYRPSTFEDMIGQEAMVTTLTNAFKAGRVAHAFMLTGVRGIGKTTTARLLARALNYAREGVDGPSVALEIHGIHCERIMASQHMDVLEMDAASRTGVDNMREMLDGVRYAPVEARYKVYIIDEVHMLSTGAFNALLKTLEEPPDHAKFIFATTEIRKVPITVLSRCQRFDLRRVDAQSLQEHLSKICAKENVKVSDEGLALIARAAEGSVRDSLSLLDQAIVQAGLDGNEVTGEQVRVMLGLADRVRVLDLFEKAAKGDGAGTLTEIRSQYEDGADPTIVMRDLLDICHEVSRAKTLGKGADFELAPDQIIRIHALAESLTLGQLTRIWQMLLKAHTEVRMAPAPLAAAEMALLKMTVAGALPAPELVAKLLTEIKSGNFSRPHSPSGPQAGAVSLEPPLQDSVPNQGQYSEYNGKEGDPIKQNSQARPAHSQIADRPHVSTVHSVSQPMSSQAKSTQAKSTQTKSTSMRAPEGEPEIISGTVPNIGPDTASMSAPKIKSKPSVVLKSIEDLVNALPENEILLASDIKRHVKPIAFKPGSIRFEPAAGASVSLTGRIVKAIQDLTGELWVVTPETHGGGKTLHQVAKEKRQAEEARDRAHPAFSHPLLAKAKLIEIIDTTPTSNETNVIVGDFISDPISDLGPDFEPDLEDD